MLRNVLLALLASVWLAPAQASLASQAGWNPLPAACTPQLRGAWAAQESTPLTLPTEGWVAVTLPDRWDQRWPDWRDATWYRLDWEVPCGDQPLALFVSAMRMAGMVYWGDELLWRDRHLLPPYSRSGNLPKLWPVSAHGQAGMHSVWIRVIGQTRLAPGLGEVILGDAMALANEHAKRTFRQRTGYIITASMSLAIALVTLTIWLWRRSEKIYLWFCLQQLSWAGYLVNLLRTEPWPWITSGTHSTLTMLFFMLLGNGFMLFTQHFLGKNHRRLNACAWLGTATLTLLIAFVPLEASDRVAQLALIWGAILVNTSALYSLIIACRTRKPEHLWLAACWTVLMSVGLHDIVVALQIWNNHETWSSIIGPLTSMFLAVLLGWRLAGYMRRIDGFNVELHSSVTQARAELAQLLKHQQAQAVENAKLQQRAEIAHDLHDGLGGNLVRSMALLEHTQELSKDRVMSLFKVLRDDLRQVIDSGANCTAPVPATPRHWLAPLRHRLTMILDELDIQVQWQIDEHWKSAPTATQCLAMARFMEEAFSNIIKHSQAQHVRVSSTQPCEMSWLVIVEDDGVGFDVAATRAAHQGIGMQSMQARLTRAHGRLEIQSCPDRTVLTAHMAVTPNAERNAEPTCTPH